MINLKTNQQAPSFELPDESGKIHRLNDYKGKWVLLYFYPKDDTPGCTLEAVNFKETIEKFQKSNVIVIGISVDTLESHKKFKEKYNLPFTLLSDPQKNVVKKYGVWGKKKFMGREFEGILRTSFLIDPNGKIFKIYENVKPATHAQEVLEELQNIKKYKLFRSKISPITGRISHCGENTRLLARN